MIFLREHHAQRIQAWKICAMLNLHIDNVCVYMHNTAYRVEPAPAATPANHSCTKTSRASRSQHCVWLCVLCACVLNAQVSAFKCFCKPHARRSVSSSHTHTDTQNTRLYLCLNNSAVRYFVDARASNVSARRRLRVFRACGATMCGFLFVRVGGCRGGFWGMRLWAKSMWARLFRCSYTRTHTQSACSPKAPLTTIWWAPPNLRGTDRHTR